MVHHINEGIDLVFHLGIGIKVLKGDCDHVIDIGVTLCPKPFAIQRAHCVRKANPNSLKSNASQCFL